MPVYAFRCPQCGREFEVTRPMRDAGNPAACPQDGTTASRIFTATAIVGGRRSEDSPASSEPSMPMPDLGHGHSHGPGGHTH